MTIVGQKLLHKLKFWLSMKLTLVVPTHKTLLMHCFNGQE